MLARTLPQWGIASRGGLFPLLRSAPLTFESGSTSLLKTPTAQLAVNGGSQHPDKRKAGGHGPTLADEVEHLIPLMGTPRASDEMKNRLRSPTNILDPRGRLEDQVALLPTPRATDGTKGGPNQKGSSGDLMLPSAVVRTPIGGANMQKPFSAGNPFAE